MLMLLLAIPGGPLLRFGASKGIAVRGSAGVNTSSRNSGGGIFIRCWWNTMGTTPPAPPTPLLDKEKLGWNKIEPQERD